MKARRDAYQAIADPTRRAIIGLLANEPQKVNFIADKFNMTRQAISLHLQILTDCGLIAIKRRGRERFCEARLDKLSEVFGWIEQYRAQWENKPEIPDLLVKTKKGAMPSSKPTDQLEAGDTFAPGL